MFSESDEIPVFQFGVSPTFRDLRREKDTLKGVTIDY